MIREHSTPTPVFEGEMRGDGPQEYALYGLRVRSHIPLPAPVCQRVTPLDGHDIEVHWGERKPLSDRMAAGRLAAELTIGQGRGYALTDTGSGYALRFYETCEFWIAPDLRSVWVHLPPDVASELAALLFVGNVLACIFTLAGEYILHASSVEVGNAALAFVGGSGVGKSTLAALLCAEGARLITDDLLRLQARGRRFYCFPDAGQIRLRQQAAVVAEGVPVLSAETTADGRVGLRLGHTRSRPPLAAIVIPRPSRQRRAVRLERLASSRALLLLMAYPRVLGLQRAELLQAQFQRFARIAASVPVYEAEIPWGPPFSAGIGEALLQGLGLVIDQTDAVRSRDHD